MLPIERRKEIYEVLKDKGSVKADDLARFYGVGVQTIRRDLKYLASEYGVEMMYGGAYLNDIGTYQTAEELNLMQKRKEHIEEKRIIGQKAAKLINDGDTIALNSGSTVEMILDYLDEEKHINVITLSINVAMKARSMSNVTVFMPGGEMRNISGAFIGAYAVDFLKQFNIDKAFMGVLAVSLKKGITHSSLDEIRVNQMLRDVSDRCYLVADYSKFDKVSLANMFDIDNFEAFITDDKLPEKYKIYCKNNDIKVL